MSYDKKDLELIKFNLTYEMTSALLEFNKLKKELIKIKKLYNLDKSDDLLLKINEIENKLSIARSEFIVQFRKSNKNQIEEYLKIKDQLWSFFRLKKGKQYYL